MWSGPASGKGILITCDFIRHNATDVVISCREEGGEPEGKALDLLVSLYVPTIGYAHGLWVSRKVEVRQGH